MRNYVDVRKLAECQPAFAKLKKYMVGIHGKAVKLSWYNNQRMNPWSVAEEGYTSPLCYQSSRSHMDSQYYPSSKKAMANKLIKEFLPKAGFTLKKRVDASSSSIWIEVNELKKVAFHVFTFRGGGIGVSVSSIEGDMGMKADIADRRKDATEKAQKAALRNSAASKLTAAERKALGL